MKYKKRLLSAILAFILAFAMIPATQVSAAKKVALSSTKVTVVVGKTKVIKIKNTTKAVKWSIKSGKSYVSISKKDKKSVTVKGNKAGTAKIQATVGSKKLICTVVVKKANTSAYENLSEEEALKKLIADQRSKGASVSEDINDMSQYVWNNGHLLSIYWSLTGVSGFIDLSAFKELEGFCCNGKSVDFTPVGEVTGLDVSKNTKLKYLYCDNNKIKNLDVSNNPELTVLHCSGNKLTKLDVSNNKELTRLWCWSNQLTQLDVSNNTKVKELWCADNRLTKLDVNNNKMLTDLMCDSGVKVTGYKGN